MKPHPPRSEPGTSTHPWRAVSWLLSAGTLALAAWLLHRYLGDLRWRDVTASLAQMPRTRIAMALAATATSLAMLATFDVLATRSALPGRVPVALAAFAGALAHAISNTLGFHAVTANATRYRIYATVGLGVGDVARIASLASLGVGFGYAVLGVIGLCLEPSFAHGWGRLAGAALLALLVLLLAWLARQPRTLRLRGWTLALPGASMASTQLLVGGIEMSAAIGAMYVLLPPSVAPGFVDFVPIYLAAVLAGIVSHAPGGLGIFEAILLSGFPSGDRAEVLAALLCYRVIYYLVPFVLGIGALAAFEAHRRLAAGTD
ncbi:hypothetical protein ASG87_00085 [Frateuria sp. Soil773]|uniref:UPF0104 family protein n=1 Tax=Frateuria sp. Soil773 TaxID=1736407 RepID=UPI0006F253E0|nr:UPF0104 family protein [Frateuria sp. Soil773]KRE97007.1 hypothetical protein ASG87_00085 [Frateuria sp. Soil773]